MASVPPEALADVPDERRFDLLLAERAALSAARQAREDNLMGTITQLSSSALLLIPGALTSIGDMPRPGEAPFLYVGIAAFAVAMCAAIAEQYLSGQAYRKQEMVSQAYYRGLSDSTHDEASSSRVRIAQQAALLAFAFAVLASAAGLAQLT